MTRSSEATMIGTQFLGLPLMFVSTAFLPSTLLPEWIRLVSVINPITYGVEATRTIMLRGWEWDVLGQAVAGLVVFDLVIGTIAVVLMKRATEARPR